jgi:hypothetical protein
MKELNKLKLNYKHIYILKIFLPFILKGEKLQFIVVIIIMVMNLVKLNGILNGDNIAFL